MAAISVKKSIDIAHSWHFQVTGNPRVTNVNFQFEGEDNYRDNL